MHVIQICYEEEFNSLCRFQRVSGIVKDKKIDNIDAP